MREVTIVDEAGQVQLVIQVWTAVTPLERTAGLSAFGESLPAGRGLLIEFPLTGEVCIWNRAIGYPIDIIFLGEDGSVIGIEREVPANDENQRCRPDVRQVLEVAAGAAHDVATGDRVLDDV